MGREIIRKGHTGLPKIQKYQHLQLCIRYMGFMLLFFNLTLLHLSLQDKLPQNLAA